MATIGSMIHHEQLLMEPLGDDYHQPISLHLDAHTFHAKTPTSLADIPLVVDNPSDYESQLLVNFILII